MLIEEKKMPALVLTTCDSSMDVFFTRPRRFHAGIRDITASLLTLHSIHLHRTFVWSLSSIRITRAVSPCPTHSIFLLNNPICSVNVSGYVACRVLSTRKLLRGNNFRPQRRLGAFVMDVAYKATENSYWCELSPSGTLHSSVIGSIALSS